MKWQSCMLKSLESSIFICEVAILLVYCFFLMLVSKIIHIGTFCAWYVCSLLYEIVGLLSIQTVCVVWGEDSGGSHILL